MINSENSTSWRGNFGPHLMVTSFVVATIICILWYLQWVPDLQLRTSGSRLDSNLRPDIGTLVARIELPPQHGYERPLNGLIVLFPQSTAPERNTVPSYIFRFSLEERNSATLVESVTSGDYTLVAALDLNANQLIDFDEDGQPTEPLLRIISHSQPESSEADIPSSEITINTQVPAYFRFSLGAASLDNE